MAQESSSIFAHELYDMNSIARQRCCRGDTKGVLQSIEGFAKKTQLAGAGDRFSTPLNLQLAEDAAVMPFDGIQGEKEPLTNLTIREPLGNQLENF